MEVQQEKKGRKGKARSTEKIAAGAWKEPKGEDEPKWGDSLGGALAHQLRPGTRLPLVFRAAAPAKQMGGLALYKCGCRCNETANLKIRA